jgi:hypothetical protein
MYSIIESSMSQSNPAPVVRSFRSMSEFLEECPESRAIIDAIATKGAVMIDGNDQVHAIESQAPVNGVAVAQGLGSRIAERRQAKSTDEAPAVNGRKPGL